jgi:hypothetical protein
MALPTFRAHSGSLPLTRLVAGFRVALACFVLVAGTACTDSPPTAPGVKKSTEAVPSTDHMSMYGPVARGMSVSGPPAGSLSAGWSAVAPFSTAVTARATQMLWQNTSTGDRSIWLMSGTDW